MHKTFLPVAVAIVALFGMTGFSPATSESVACPFLASANAPATAIAGLSDCPTGAITISDPNGPGRVSLPPPGISVTYAALVEHGAPEVAEFTVFRSRNGDVAAQSVGVQGTQSYGPESVISEFEAFGKDFSTLATSPKCDSYAYSVNGQRWISTVGWYYKTPSFGGQARVAAAFTAMADGIGACGQNKPNSASHSYLGTTTSSANMSGSICLASDLKNVVDSGAVATTTTLAQACTYRTSVEIVSADIRVNSAKTWYTGLSVTGCTGGSYDLQGVVTHEVGHLYGLNHVAGSTQQVMKPTSATCETSQRTLGNGDLAGMKYLYP